jgi:hypothetical protein
MTKLSALLTTAILSISVPSFADGRWAANHPRRDEVNDRLANQDHRIDAGVRDGQLSRGQARQLHREDHAIRAEERAYASEHHGHITAGEQRRLNRQETTVSRQIHTERKY